MKHLLLLPLLVLLFGCADGYIYCLTADDGRLVWRFRAAPEDRQMVAFEQVESVWPVHGAVLVRDDVAYVTAGRHGPAMRGAIGWFNAVWMPASAVTAETPACSGSKRQRTRGLSASAASAST